MSIPTTETKPDGLHSLPPRQRRSLRKYIETASTRDKNDLLRDIARHALPQMQDYWQLLICLLLLVIGNLIGSNLVLLAGIIAIPMAKPLLSLVYAGALPSARHFWHALLGLVITLAGFFLAGWIVRNVVLIQADRFLSGVDFSGITEGGLFWVILVVTSALTAYWFTYHEVLSRLSSILIGYLVLMPFMAAGQSASADFAANSLPLIMVGLTRLGLALLVMFLTTWVLGFPPRKSLGTFIAVLIFAIATVSLIEIIQREQVSIQAQRPEPTIVIVQTATPVPPTPTAPPPTATATSVPSPTLEPIPSPEPTATVPTYTSARVTAPNGLVIREGPSTSSYILTYVNFDELVWLTGIQETNQGITWDQVVAPDGAIGWISTRYLEMINP
ncbi:MAG TPA: SH3 domain-containing protein [Anaerolineaceae bacterium]|nr:SH3 domain-containing protein [Anaerolineaceae bacterium]HQJ32274.1 SH3 domain-containing protein [Anaerolineaceae bacterium]